MPMLVAPSESVTVKSPPVEVVFLLDDGVVSRPGRILVRRAHTYDVELERTPPDLPADARVVLSIGGELPRRVIGRLESRDGQRLRVTAQRAQAPDKRRFPRLFGAIGLRWRRLRGEREDPWRAPDPLMSFSVQGLAFGGAGDEAEEGDLLSLDFTVGSGTTRFQALGRVVRVSARAADDVVGGETHEIAVELLDAPEPAREALAEHMLRIQRAFTRERH